MMPWGVENLTIYERYQKAVEAGVDLFSGSADPTALLETIKKGMISEERIDESITRLLREKFELGIFENPYVEEEAAETVVGNVKSQERADLAHRKSIVLLRNEKSLLPLKPKTKVYFEKYLVSRGSEDPHNVVAPEEHDWNIEFVKSAEEADVVVLWLFPKSAGLFGSRGDEIKIDLSANSIDVDYVNKMKAKKPTVVAINFSSPWVISEIEKEKTQTILATFGTTTDALLDIVTGKFNPTGKMPISIPVSTEAVLKNKSDVPGYQKQEGYALFKFNDGLAYN